MNTAELNELKHRAPDAVDAIHALLGCDWGHKVVFGEAGFTGTIADTPGCDEAAVRVSKVYGDEQFELVRLCTKHTRMLEDATDPHQTEREMQ